MTVKGHLILLSFPFQKNNSSINKPTRWWWRTGGPIRRGNDAARAPEPSQCNELCSNRTIQCNIPKRNLILWFSTYERTIHWSTKSRSNILVQWLCSVLNRKVPHQQFACFISHSSGAPSPTVESLFSRSFIHPRFQFPIHPMTWLVAQVTHLIHPRQPSHNSSQECFCYFIHFNPIHGIGCGWVRGQDLLLVSSLSSPRAASF